MISAPGSTFDRCGQGAFAMVLIFLSAASARPETSFRMFITGPSELFGKAGEVVHATYEVSVDGQAGLLEAPPSLEGWGFGVAATGVEIEGITIEGTAADHAAAYGFERSEVTSGPGNEGVIGKAIYSLTEPRRIAVPHPPKALLKIQIKVVIPELSTQAALEFRDGLNGSVDTPAEIFVQENGRRQRPALLGARISVLPYRSSFTLGFEGPAFFAGEPGTPIRTRWFCTLAGTSNLQSRFPEVDGWALGIVGDGLRITGITVAGTDAEPALTGGFVHNELLAEPGNEGAISVVTFSTSPGTALRMGYTPRLIAALDLETRIPATERVITLTHVDGLRASSGVVANAVKEGGEGIQPSLQDGRMYLASTEPCGNNLVGFSTVPISSPAPFDGVLGGLQTTGEIVVPVPAASKASTKVYANLIAMGASVGCDEVQGFSLSVSLAGDARPVSASLAEPLLRLVDDGFKRAELADPALNGGGAGFLGVWVPSFCCEGLLPLQGTVSALEMTLEPSIPVLDEGARAELRFSDGLRGAGQPLQNVITVCGSSVSPCNLEVASAVVRFQPVEGRFVRGNANGDLQLDIADAVWILNLLFSGGDAGSCAAAADSNDDDKVDLSDAIHLLSFQFLGGSPPPAPFPECGLDLTGPVEGRSCEETQFGCR